MSTTIQSTTNYSRFKFMEGNRPVNKRVKSIITAVKANNQLALYPIVCRKNGDGRLYIADGQHRFTAAKELGLPIYYIESKDVTLADVIASNSVQKSWTLKDHVDSRAALGDQNYIMLKAFYDAYKLPLTTCIHLLSRRNGIDGGAIGNQVRAGAFKVNKDATTYARNAAEFILSIKPIFAGALDRSFVIAVARLMELAAFSPERLLQKLKWQSTKMVRCANWFQYVELIDGIYNAKVSASELISLPLEVKKIAAK